MYLKMVDKLLAAKGAAQEAKMCGKVSSALESFVNLYSFIYKT